MDPVWTCSNSTLVGSLRAALPCAQARILAWEQLAASLGFVFCTSVCLLMPLNQMDKLKDGIFVCERPVEESLQEYASCPRRCCLCSSRSDCLSLKVCPTTGNST
ncbi:uncharacterized protein BJX67DRAFT_169317 [Aspergillus lucknowensis]|uniref:Uncharacterized protein n=1 Tax=Aspergillus lucknowensis TaxID=176173 RepID=A0ABR4LMB8_9EURO